METVMCLRRMFSVDWNRVSFWIVDRLFAVVGLRTVFVVVRFALGRCLLLLLLLLLLFFFLLLLWYQAMQPTPDIGHRWCRCSCRTCYLGDYSTAHTVHTFVSFGFGFSCAALVWRWGLRHGMASSVRAMGTHRASDWEKSLFLFICCLKSSK